MSNMKLLLEQVQKELKINHFIDLGQYYYYDNSLEFIKYLHSEEFNPFKFNKEGNNIFGFNIYKDSVEDNYKQDLIDEEQKEEKIEKYKQDIYKTIDKLVNDTRYLEEFIKTKKISVEGLIAINKKYKYNGRLNVSLIRRKENYITLTRPFITDEYLNSVEFVGKDYIPTLEQIEAARKNLIKSNKLINYYNMKKTIGYLINGVIDANDQNNYNFVEDVRKNFIKEIAERKKAKRRLQYSRIAVKRRD